MRSIGLAVVLAVSLTLAPFAEAQRVPEVGVLTLGTERFDRGPHVSFANCGLPYFVGDVITEERSLLVASPQLFRDRFRIEVKTRHEVTTIDRAGRAITVGDLTSGRESAERYDALVLSPGAAPIRPPLPGIDLPGIFAVRNIPDSVLIRAWIDERRPLGRDGHLVLDVRNPDEHAAGHLPEAVNIPLSQLRERVDELPRDRTIDVACGVGQRAYYAVRFLAQRGVSRRQSLKWLADVPRHARGRPPASPHVMGVRSVSSAPDFRKRGRAVGDSVAPA